MRVLTVTNMYPCKGLDYYGIFVREHVDALVRRGLDVDVFFTNPRKGRQRYFTDLPRLVKILRHGAYDVLHAHHTYSVLQVALGRRIVGLSTPLLFTIHEGEANLLKKADRPEADLLKRLIYWKRPKRLALRLSDCVVTVASSLTESVGYTGPFTVIPPAVDCNLFRPLDQDECRRTLGLPKNARILLFPADPSRPEKGWELFERAVDLLTAPVHVVSGGSLSRSEMPLYMNAANVVVQTSRFEASPMVVKEAMACNIATVSTDVGDVKSLFGNTPGCFCASGEPEPLAKAIESALAFTGCVRGRERVLELGLTPEIVAKRYSVLYDDITTREHSA